MSAAAKKKEVNIKTSAIYKNKIITAIQETESGLTPSQIAKKLQIARPTATKYIEELSTEGKVQSHTVGHYQVYTIPKLCSASQILYCCALKGLNDLAAAVGFRKNRVALQLQEQWEGQEELPSLPFEEELSQIKGQPTPANLEQLMEIASRVIREHDYFNKLPKVEIVPLHGGINPMTRMLRVKDPGFIAAGAVMHYYVLAGLIQVKLAEHSQTQIVFRVAQEPVDDVVYFEIGFIENYLMDISIIEYNDPVKQPRDLLDKIKALFASTLRLRFREYIDNHVLHYELKILDNYRFEEYFSSCAKTFRKNAELLQKHQVMPIRKWLPYEDWPDKPYAVVEMVTNLGFAFDEFHQAVVDTFPQGAYCVHFEKIPNGIRMNFLESIDFDMLFTNNIDENATREQYKSFGITSEAYFADRRKALQDLLMENARKRIERHALKRRKQKNM